MFWSHIACHFTAAGKVTPRGKHFKYAVRLPLPDKPVGTIRAFFTCGRSIENDFDGMVKKVDCLVILCQES